MLALIRKCEAAVLHHDNSVDINVVYSEQNKQLEAALKQQGSHSSSSSSKKKLVLLWDIEGTITALPFVTKQLFPRFLEALPGFASTHISTRVVDSVLDRRRERENDAGHKEKKQSQDDEQTSPLFSEMCTVLSAFVAYVRSSDAKGNNSPVSKEALEDVISSSLSGGRDQRAEKMCALIVLDAQHNSSKNLKVAWFKILQGIVWREMYERGQIHGHIFSDVISIFAANMLSSGSSTGGTKNSAFSSVTNHIYSSGSIAAQKLLLRHSRAGHDDGVNRDLTQFVQSYHDTVTAGSKMESSSYLKIKNSLLQSGDEHNQETVFCFVSDSVKELQAARAAGFVTVLAIRPMNAAAVAPEMSENDVAAAVSASIFSAFQIYSCVHQPVWVSGANQLEMVRADVKMFQETCDASTTEKERKTF